MTERPWWMNPTNRFANAIYPHLTESGKEKAKRKKVDPNARGFVSPLGGVAVESREQPEQRRK
jgi:hypothetical protein